MLTFAFQGYQRASAEMGIEAEVHLVTQDFLEELLVCAVRGEYEHFTQTCADEFWHMVGKSACPEEEYRNFVVALVGRVPALREPLLRALRERDPARGLYELLEGKPEAGGGEEDFPQPPMEFMPRVDGPLSDDSSRTEGRNEPPGG